MAYHPSNPLIAQSDKTVLLEVNNPLYEEGRDALARFAELEKSPEHIHTYRITPLSLWNAAAAGLDAASIVGALERFGKYELAGNVRADIVDAVARYGRVTLVQEGQHLLLVSEDRPLLVEIEHHKHIAPCLIGRHLSGGLLVASSAAVWLPRRGPGWLRQRRAPGDCLARDDPGWAAIHVARLPA